MKAVVVEEVGNRDSVHVTQVSDPVPGEGEVVVDVVAAAANFPDLLLIEGKYQSIPPVPFVPGMDAAGPVRRVGDGVNGLRPGDRVLVQVPHGAFAEKVKSHVSRVYRLPENVDYESAAAGGLTYQTAWVGLVERGRLSQGQTVLVTGAAGGVGMAAVQVARALGARVIAGVGTPEKAPAVRDAGAHEVIELAGDDLRESLRGRVMALTDGRGVDLVFDPVGGDVFDASLRAVAFCGRVVVVGFACGRIPEVRTNYLLLKNISVDGFSLTGFVERAPEVVARAQLEIFTLMRSGAMRPHVMAVFPLERFADALTLLERRQVVGKVLLRAREESPA